MAAQTQVDNIIGRLAALINLMAFGTLEHASNTCVAQRQVEIIAPCQHPPRAWSSQAKV